MQVAVSLTVIIIVDQKFWTYYYGYYNQYYIVQARITCTGLFICTINTMHCSWGAYFTITIIVAVLQNTCYLGSYNESTNLCYFNWSMAAIGAFCVLVVFFLALCSFRRPGRAMPFLILFFVAAAIYLAQGIVNTTNIGSDNQDAYVQNNEGVDLQGWRHAVEGLSWTAFGLTALAVLATGFDLANNKRMPAQTVRAHPFMLNLFYFKSSIQ